MIGVKDCDGSISRIPISQGIFRKITDRFKVHRSITRTVNRGVVYFNYVDDTEDGNQEGTVGALKVAFPLHSLLNRYICLGFTMRLSASWPGDLALSATYFQTQGLTLGIVFGCGPEQKRRIVTRLRNSDDAFLHPLLVVGILCELDRDRLVKATDRIVDKFVGETVRLIEGGQELHKFIAIDGISIQQSLDNYSNCNHLGRGLRDAQRQLQKIMNATSGPPVLLSPAAHRDSCAKTGRRIRERLQEISDEYQSKIEECESYMKESSHLLQTVSLADGTHVFQSDITIAGHDATQYNYSLGGNTG